jgi:hypothetical protein
MACVGHHDQTPTRFGNCVDLFGPQDGSGANQSGITKGASEALDAGQWGRGIQRHLDDLKTSLDENRADRYRLIGVNTAQNGDERNAL